MKISITLLLSLLLLAFTFTERAAYYESRTVTGRVTDKNQNPITGVTVRAAGSKLVARTDKQGKYSLDVPAQVHKLTFNLIGYQTLQSIIPISNVLNVILEPGTVAQKSEELEFNFDKRTQVAHTAVRMSAPMGIVASTRFNTENYNPIKETGFQHAANQPVTTFSADVDRAAYSNVRRILNMGQMPPADAVRIEEMINYFDYNYPQPTGKHPLGVSTELTDSPWNPGLKLLHIGIQAKKIPNDKLAASNLVFLIDVSGSMMHENKLPLLKQAFKLLVDQLRPQDHVAIVTYAGAAGIALAPTSGDEKVRIKDALDQLEAGGSTAGAEGIETAYKLAKEHFIAKGNNRVILATDGDFNVGVSSEGGLQRLIETKRKEGIFLSVMGFGMGNYKDSHMETLADKGNGNYAYIDNIQEARKEFVEEFGGTLFTVAKDVKIQIEFNPSLVEAYRLIGYENRVMQNEEFNDDKKDAGDLGSAHTVTALYEIVPKGTKSDYLGKMEPLKYQKNASPNNGKSDEMLTIKVRYKQPDSERSEMFETAVANDSKAFDKCSANLRFASAVAEFGLLIRSSEFKGKSNYDHIVTTARAALDKDPEGYRSEFMRLVKTSKSLDNSKETARKD